MSAQPPDALWLTWTTATSCAVGQDIGTIVNICKGSGEKNRWAYGCNACPGFTVPCLVNVGHLHRHGLFTAPHGRSASVASTTISVYVVQGTAPLDVPVPHSVRLLLKVGRLLTNAQYTAGTSQSSKSAASSATSSLFRRPLYCHPLSQGPPPCTTATEPVPFSAYCQWLHLEPAPRQLIHRAAGTACRRPEARETQRVGMRGVCV